MKDLFDILANDISMEGYCSREYDGWEQNVATPALQALGYEVVSWTTGEKDSFGPLSRVVTVRKEGAMERFVYG
jgi:hypothetical protein